MFMLAPPLLVSVTVCVAVEPISVAGKVKLDGDKDAMAGVVPVSVTDCGLPAALSEIVTAPLIPSQDQTSERRSRAAAAYCSIKQLRRAAVASTTVSILIRVKEPDERRTVAASYAGKTRLKSGDGWDAVWNGSQKYRPEASRSEG